MSDRPRLFRFTRQYLVHSMKASQNHSSCVPGECPVYGHYTGSPESRHMHSRVCFTFATRLNRDRRRRQRGRMPPRRPLGHGLSGPKFPRPPPPWSHIHMGSTTTILSSVDVLHQAYRESFVTALTRAYPAIALKHVHTPQAPPNHSHFQRKYLDTPTPQHALRHTSRRSGRWNLRQRK